MRYAIFVFCVRKFNQMRNFVSFSVKVLGIYEFHTRLRFSNFLYEKTQHFMMFI